MNQNEQDAMIGKTHREYREAKKKLDSLQKQTHEIAAAARRLADALERHPECVHVSSGPEGSLALAIANARYIYTPEIAAQFTQEFLRRHLAELVEVRNLKETTERELHELNEYSE